MDMKKIVILGAGIYQVPLIIAAKKMGLYVIVVSIPGDYPGFACADKVYEINTTDKEAILAMAKEEQISAIVTTGTDVAVPTVGYVCDAMGLSGISYESAKLATDKAFMKVAFWRGGVTTAPFRVIKSYEEAQAALKEIGLPAILKIVDKSGSRGITKINVAEALREAYDYAVQETGTDHMILEQFIHGHEIGIDAFVQNGQIKAIVPHDKLVFQTGRTGIPMGHICPMEGCSKSLSEKLEQETIKVIRALGLNQCAVNMDVFVTPDDDVYVIEAAGRCGATGIPEVMSGYLGVDYYEVILKNALGEIVEIPSGVRRPTASLLIHSQQSGCLDSISYEFDRISYVQEDSAVSGVGWVQLDYKPGARIHAMENGTHRIGQAIFMADTTQEIFDRMEAFRRSLQVQVH